MLFYHKHESKMSIFIKFALFWVGLILIIFTFFALTNKSDLKIPQKEIIVKVDIGNKVNICLPDEQAK